MSAQEEPKEIPIEEFVKQKEETVESEVVPKKTNEVAIIISLTEGGKINIEADPYERVSFVLADMEQGKQFGYPVTWPEVIGASALVYLKQMLASAEKMVARTMAGTSYGELKYD